MDEQQSHISQIVTSWTLIEQAHQCDAEDAPRAQLALLLRYQRAIHRYLLAILRDVEAVDEVFQDFAVRFLQGGLRHASSDRGRFRNYLKTTLIRMAIDYRRGQGRRAREKSDHSPEPAAWVFEPDAERLFDEGWRDEVLRKTWQALQAWEEERGQPYFTALRHRCDHPEESSSEMAAALSGKRRDASPYTETAARKLLQRAREKFGELLLREVAATIDTDHRDDLEAELATLELLPFCRSALRQWKS